ncbi:lysine-specific demethylase JMJ25-like isoform X2 [Trifolium pratense]|uniref:lysine-specific demethylase JMJ25-like isoform X2 n=1 Tax=Trifolium pratense TaxID=57577 RepID=UPI001E69547C|nr:lysine-specific demethylase JMJ25-like isoform X2 [Trifolium pratense]
MAVVDNHEKHCGRKRKCVWSSKESEVAHEEGDNNEDAKTNEDMKVDDELSLYLLKELLPYLKQLSQKEMTEIEIEASNQGLSLSELSISKLDDLDGERLYCDNCKTSIFALHKHCQTCECDFCIACCHDFCDAQLRDGADPIESCVTVKPGVHKHPRSDRHEDSDDRVCCDGFLELKSFYPPSHIVDLVDEAEKIVDKYKHYMIVDKTHKNLHSCLNRKAASREESSDNDIYCPKAKNVHPEDLLHFQWHWRKGEPVIVGNVLGGASNSLWEPSGMSRAICLKHKKVKVTDCLSLMEVCAISQSKH